MNHYLIFGMGFIMGFMFCCFLILCANIWHSTRNKKLSEDDTAEYMLDTHSPL